MTIEEIKDMIRENEKGYSVETWEEKIKNSDLSAEEKHDLITWLNADPSTEAMAVDGDTDDIKGY